MPLSDSKHIASFLLRRVKDFFPSRADGQLKRLFVATAILDFAVAAVALFEPIYLYSIGMPVYQIMWFYCGLYVLYFFLMPLGGRIVKERGFAHGMAYGSFFLVLYYLFLFAASVNMLFIIPALVAMACQKACYWPGFHAEMAFFGKSKERGREVGGVVALASIVSAIGPLVGGAMISLFGFPTLFVLASSLILLSNLPLLLTREVFTPSTLGYMEPYNELVAPRNRRYFFAFAGFAEELVFLGVWPIFVFITLDSVLDVGVLAGAVTIVATLALVVIGRLTDVRDRKEMMTTGAIMYTLSWFMRLLVRGGGGVFMSGLFAGLSKHLLVLPMIAGLYEHAMKTSIVKTVIFFEMSLTVGKIIIAAILACVFYFYPSAWHASFILAGMVSLLYILLGRKTDHVVR